MLSYCLSCRQNTRSKNPEFVRKNPGRIMILSRCAVCIS